MTKRKQDDEDIKVDVAAFDGISAFVDSEDDGELDEIYHLPTIHTREDDQAADEVARKKRREKRKREKEKEKEMQAASSSITMTSTVITTQAMQKGDIKEEFVEILGEAAVDKKPRMW